ncbi:MAG TPA: gephyrin-like molybdotransferase Glp [Chloroflexota bacterium]|nr:gephyrin-like molybdotransferase Glp [Chloroflexota bacterium]
MPSPEGGFPALMPFDDALAQMLAEIPVLGIEERPIREALGQVMAEDVHAPLNVPPFSNSAMDGFAVRAVDTPGTLRVIADQAAGHVTDAIVERGTAIRIMTGAVIPTGADAVVPVEETEGLSSGSVNIPGAVARGVNVREAGEDIRQGQLVLARGTPLTPATIGVLASVGRPRVKVHRAPTVAFMASGDELVDAGEPVGPGQIRNSNSYSMYCQIGLAGGIALDLGVARDTLPDIRAHVEQGLRADLFVTSAGVSVGDFDYVRQVLEERGKLRLWRIAIRPGRPVAFGVFEGTPVFSLPGNPVSSMVCFELFVRPAIAKMRGHTRLRPPYLPVRVGDEVDNRGGRRSFLRAIVSREGDGFSARLTGPQGSGMLTSMARANALLDVPADVGRLPAGSAGQALMLDWPEP